MDVSQFVDPIPAPPPASTQPSMASLRPPAFSAPPPPPAVVPKSKFPLKAVLAAVLMLVVAGVGVFFGLRLLGPKPDQRVTLTWWGLWESKDIVEPLIEEYQNLHPNITINYEFHSPREYRERLQSAFSQGTGPDIFRLHNSWVPMFKADLAPVPAEVYSASTYESTFYSVVQSDLRVGSNYVAIPLMFDGLGMYVNEELLGLGGKEAPRSWVELRETAYDLSVCDTEDGQCRPGARVLISGTAMGTTENVDHWQDIVAVLMLQNNVNLNSPSGKAAEDVLEYFTIFSRSDGIWNSTLPSSTESFAQGKVAIYFGPSWRTFDIKAINPQLKFKIYPIPQLPIDPARGEKPVTWASYWAEGVNAKSQNTRAAWEFVGWLTQSETLQKFYQTAVASGRAFGEPYPRIDMAALVQNDPHVGAYISQAPNAKSWYLASFTWDGPTGINSRLGQYFADAINAANQGRQYSEAVQTLNSGINQVLSQYGLAVSAPANP